MPKKSGKKQQSLKEGGDNENGSSAGTFVPSGEALVENFQPASVGEGNFPQDNDAAAAPAAAPAVDTTAAPAVEDDWETECTTIEVPKTQLGFFGSLMTSTSLPERSGSDQKNFSGPPVSTEGLTVVSPQLYLQWKVNQIVSKLSLKSLSDEADHKSNGKERGGMRATNRPVVSKYVFAGPVSKLLHITLKWLEIPVDDQEECINPFQKMCFGKDEYATISVEKLLEKTKPIFSFHEEDYRSCMWENLFSSETNLQSVDGLLIFVFPF